MKNMLPKKTTGLTLVEMTVAVVSASILITAVFATWNRISTTTETRKRRTVLHSECGRITDLITGSIQKAQAVLGYDRTSIRLLTGEAADTVVFSLDGTTLLRNGSPLGMLLPGVTVTEFSFENKNDETGGQPYLFRFNCTLVSRQNDTASMQATVMGRRPGDGSSPTDNDFMW